MQSINIIEISKITVGNLQFETDSIFFIEKKNALYNVQ